MKPIQWNAKLWKESVEQFHKFLSPLIAGLGRSERRVAATRYVEGLLMPESIIPMAERLGVDAQSLQQFVTDSPWSDETLWGAIRQEVIPHLEPLEAWVVDETGWVKQGSHSVGVSHQFTSTPAPCILLLAPLNSRKSLYIKPRFDPALISWLWKFGTACRTGPVRKGMPILRGLNHASLALRTTGEGFRVQRTEGNFVQEKSFNAGKCPCESKNAVTQVFAGAIAYSCLISTFSERNRLQSN